MTARMHHYVPKFYLKNFAQHADKPKLAVFDRVTGKRFDAPPSKVAVERDFNRIDIEGHPPDALESAFADFESEASKAITRIIAARSISDQEDFLYVLNLIALLATRNPRFRGTFSNFQREIVQRIMEITVSSKEIYETQMHQAARAGVVEEPDPVGYEAMKKFVRSGAFKIEIPTTRSLMFELNGMDTVLSALVDRKWMLLRAPPKTAGFVTSDHPVCLLWSSAATDSGIYSPGFGLTGTEVLFPLCNELALVGTFELSGRVIDVPPAAIAGFNARVIAFAERQVYARSAEFLYSWSDTDKLRPGRELLNDRRFPKMKGRDKQL